MPTPRLHATRSHPLVFIEIPAAGRYILHGGCSATGAAPNTPIDLSIRRGLGGGIIAIACAAFAGPAAGAARGA